MRRPVIWANTAREEYLSILHTIAADNPYAAERVAQRIEEAAAALSEFATGRPGRVTGTYERVLPGLPYILAYELFNRPDGEEAVVILHVIHGRRDWPAEQWPRG